MRGRVLLWLMAGLVLSAHGAGAAPMTLTVCQSASCPFQTLSAAANTETSGNTYTINVSAGPAYTNDFPVITQPTDIEAVGGMVTLDNTGFFNNQGIITTSANLTVNGLTIIGAVASDLNSSAAAIRDHNDGSANANTLIVTNSVIENSQNGIQTQGSGNKENVTIKNDTFIGNGGLIGPAHALYIGDAATADIINSTFCGTNFGHDIKSRALTTIVTGSTMWVGSNAGAPAGCAVGSASAGVDLPNGGVGMIQNDTIIQGSANSNGALVIYGGESPLNPGLASLDVSGTKFQGDGSPFSIGVNVLSGCPQVTGTGTAEFQNLGSNISIPAGCAASSVPEPRSIAVLAMALVGFGLGYVNRARRWT